MHSRRPTIPAQKRVLITSVFVRARPGRASASEACAYGVHAIIGRIVNLIWFLVCWFTLVGLVCAVLGAFYFYDHVDEGIRAQVEQRLSRLYPDFHIKVGSAKLIEREGFEIRGVSFASKSTQQPPVLFVDEILVRCRPSIEDLLRKDPKIQELIVRHVTLHAWQRPGADWNFLPLFHPPQSDVVVPKITVEHGTVQIVGAAGESFDLRNIDAHVQAVEDNPQLLQINLACTGNHLKRAAVRCRLNRRQMNWSVTGSVHELDISPKLQASIPPEFAAYLKPLQGLEARTNLQLNIQRHPQLLPSLQYEVAGQLQGRWNHSALAFPVTDLTGNFLLTHAGQRFKDLTGRYGDAAVSLSCQRDGTALESPIRIVGRVNRLRVDQNMIGQLPPDWQRKWQQFRPLGLVDSDFQLDYAHGIWTPQVNVHCRNVSFVWEKHPYPIESAAGEMSFWQRGCKFELHSINPKQPVRFVGDVNAIGPDWTGWVEAYVDDPIPVDERVISAMTEKAQDVVRPFTPSGSMTMYSRAERANPEVPPARHSIVNFQNGVIRHEKFPYPLQNVSARLERRGTDWRFTNIVGENDGAQIQCEGEWHESDGGGLLQLRFTGTNVPLEEELRTALSPTAQHLWNQLRPQGALDKVQATFNYQVPSGQTELVFNTQKLPAERSQRGHSLSLNPVSFPYRIDNVSGSVTVANDQIRLERIRGTHGKVQLTTDGVAEVQRDGPWRMTFSPIAVDRLRVDDELSAALPPAIRNMFSRLQLSGPLSLGGRVEFAGNARSRAATRASWKLDVDLEDGRLNTGVPLEHISGTVHLEGRTAANQGHCRGSLNIDSLICRGIQLANVRGPMWVDHERLLFGKRALPTEPNLPAQHLTAALFGGELNADVEIALTEDGPFRVQARLSDARAAELTRMALEERIDGRAWANVDLSGNSRGPHTWIGSGAMQLRETNLYELPAVLSLLKNIRTGSSDRTAFTSSDIAFHLKGQHVYFDQLDLHGDALTLKGVGEMDLDRKLDLNFYTMMGREDSYLPAIRPLLGMASRRFLLVRVAGNANQPTMTREVLPDLNDTLRRLFPEAQPAMAPNEISPILPGEVSLASGAAPIDPSATSPDASQSNTIRR